MKIQIGKWLIVIATFVSLMFVVTGLEAGKGGVKPDKPDRTTAECIIFYGEDMQGVEEVEGCCPNAGPFPAYWMTLLGTQYNGNLFINNYGAGRDHKYIVQFWNDYIGIEIIGGVIDNDKKSKVLTVTFTEEEATLWEYEVGERTLDMSFVLVRTSDLSHCD
jgi:hypothetical protein